MQRAADAVELVGAALLVLGFLEERQHRIPIPALTAALPPAVIIHWRAAHIDHAIDRAGAAEHLAARLVESAVVELLLGFALEHPVEPRVGKRLRVAERNVDPRIAVAAACFEQQHAPASGFAEPSRDGTTGRSGAGDDKVKDLARSRHSSFPKILAKR